LGEQGHWLVGLDLDELVVEYQHAERSLRDALLGDGVYSSGAVRGEEMRTAVGTRLRRLHATFEEAVQVAKASQEHVDELEAELRARRRPAARRARTAPAAKPTKSTAATKKPAGKTKP
jgi:23S rRNA maturation mini-RNase III